ncbi:MAG TPA: hypothetical protein VGQ46_02120 [Thermoanaerobaculia bacterium]|nr:hypothetical protein [Thermoanaerobaculia bacterium]
MTARRSLLLALPLLALALGASAQTAPYDIELGIRIAKVDGNHDMYRTQTDETSGLLLRSFSLLTPGPDGAKFFDRLRIDASDLGAGPAGSLRIEADKAGAYRFRLGYRHMNMFSALPTFANPLLGSGITTSQHTYDRTRNLIDADLELFPDRGVVPFIGYSFNRLSGPGTSTYTVGGDEFRLSQSLRETEHEFRLGAGFHLGLLRGSITQGWRSVRGNESLSLLSSSGDGNNPDPLLGRPVVATGIRRDDRTRVSTPFTNFYVTGQSAKRLRLTGNYVRFAADSTGDGSEDTAGSFVSFALSRFFSGLTEQASTQAKNTAWRSGARAELAVRDGIDSFAGYQKEHRDLEGSALIDTLFLQNLTFGGVDPGDVERVLNARGSITRNEDVLNAGASARAFGPFAMRVEIRDAKQNVDVSPDLSEIVVPGNQGGRFERNLRTLDTNASYTRSGFTLGAAWRQDRANQPIFRTDFRDRDRLRLRAAWRAPKWVRAGATAEETRQSNSQPGIDLAGKSRQYGGDVEVTPHEGVVVRGSLTRFLADNSILIRRPENFATDRSVYTENGTSYEAGGGFRRAALSFDASVARFTNRGDHPFDLDRLRFTAGCDLPPKTKMGLVIEFARDNYRERNAAFADFDARRVGMFLRYHP